MNIKTIINKKGAFDYEILERFEAGIALKGFEVKSIKTGHINLRGSFVTVKNNELYLTGANISPYQPKNTPADYDPTRSRKLLLNNKEIKYLIGKSQQKGLTLVPVRVYIKNNLIKLEFGVAKGKKRYDKREIIKKREFERKKGDDRF